MKKYVALAILVAGAMLQAPLAAQQAQPFVRDPKIPVDAEYTRKIKEYTTEPFFTSPLVDYLPASKTVPTPKEVAHDNNRDAMGATLKLTEHVLNTYMQWHPQVLHDLHESVPYL